MKELTMQDLVSYCKTMGFIFPGSEIYGGLANSWDYGPLGVELKNNIKSAWWKRFVQTEPNNVGLDSAIIASPRIWEASGHLASFSDPLMDCRACKSRHRADKLIENWLTEQEQKGNHIETKSSEAMSDAEMEEFIQAHKIPCPDCGKCDFTRAKLPFGICQIGKSFRNEITPGNFIFRTREFEQMEMEFFCHPNDAEKWFEHYRHECMEFCKNIGVNPEKLRFRDHDKEELVFYSKATTDIEFNYPFGWSELWGIANRTNYDLTQHQKFSGEDLTYTDPFTNEKFTPFVVEPSVGVDRLLLAVLCSAYTVEDLPDNDSRIVLKLHKSLAPIKVAVLPLSKKLEDSAQKLYADLSQDYRAQYDASGSIGKRYRRQDEIGTPYCVTVDFETETDQSVTVRDRDTMLQERVKITELNDWLRNHLK